MRKQKWNNNRIQYWKEKYSQVPKGHFALVEASYISVKQFLCHVSIKQVSTIYFNVIIQFGSAQVTWLTFRQKSLTDSLAKIQIDGSISSQTYPILSMMKWPLSHMQVMMQIENFGAILSVPSFFLTINLNNHIL